jgi:hypothetical protein
MDGRVFYSLISHLVSYLACPFHAQQVYLVSVRHLTDDYLATRGDERQREN